MKKKKNNLKNEMKLKKSTIYIILSIILIALIIYIVPTSSENIAILKTNYGTIEIQLYNDKAPITVQNFKSYVKDDFYNGLIFHRVINNFMIQGGGFNSIGNQKNTNAPIKLESNNGLKNNKYTISMARTNDPNSATSQFFINTNNNEFLNYASTNPGYTVFGKVIKGKDVVDKIEKVKTSTKRQMKNWPVDDITIISISLK